LVWLVFGPEFESVVEVVVVGVGVGVGVGVVEVVVVGVGVGVGVGVLEVVGVGLGVFCGDTGLVGHKFPMLVSISDAAEPKELRYAPYTYLSNPSFAPGAGKYAVFKVYRPVQSCLAYNVLI
jgi:hypothetical protein